MIPTEISAELERFHSITLRSDVLDMVVTLVRALNGGRCVAWCGNGGSEANAHHLAGELLGRFNKLGRPPLRSLPLLTGGPAVSGICNDFGYDHVFEHQVYAHLGAGDVLVLLSTSGHSRNLELAADAGLVRGVTLVGLVPVRPQRVGGRPLLDQVHLHVIGSAPTDVAEAQEQNLAVGHLVCRSVELVLFPDLEDIVQGQSRAADQ